MRSPDSVSTLPIPINEGDVLPKWIENILGCAAFFIQIDEAEQNEEAEIGGEAGAILYVANPPLAVEIKEGDTGNIGQRGEGYILSQEAERFEIPIEVLRDEEEEVEQELKTKRGPRNRNKQGSGRGKGRGGAQRKPETSQEREVKILLRRPVEPDKVPVDTDASAPVTNVPASATQTTVTESASRIPDRSSAPGRSDKRDMNGTGEIRSTGRGDSRGRGRSGGRGRGRGKGGFHGGEFVMLQRPGPPLATYTEGASTGNPPERRGGGTPVVLLQRPK